MNYAISLLMQSAALNPNIKVIMALQFKYICICFELYLCVMLSMQQNVMQEIPEFAKWLIGLQVQKYFGESASLMVKKIPETCWLLWHPF